MSTPSTTLIRPYRPEDRRAVRDICWQTAFMGQPIDFMYRDRESWVDLFSRHYTDREPECCFVAENAAGEVIGYVTGSANARQLSVSFMLFVWRHVLLRAVALRPGSAAFWWRLVWDSLTDPLRDPVRQPSFSHSRHPAEMHINLLPEGRASGVARGLVLAWYTHLRSQGLPGGWGAVLGHNERSLRFLEKTGFRRIGDLYLIPGMRGRDGSRLRGQHVLFDLETAPHAEGTEEPSTQPAPRAEDSVARTAVGA